MGEVVWPHHLRPNGKASMGIGSGSCSVALAMRWSTQDFLPKFSLFLNDCFQNLVVRGFGELTISMEEYKGLALVTHAKMKKYQVT